jgi:hypothetical protein
MDYRNPDVMDGIRKPINTMIDLCNIDISSLLSMITSLYSGSRQPLFYILHPTKIDPAISIYNRLNDSL